MRKHETGVIHGPEFGGSSKKARENMDILVKRGGNEESVDWFEVRELAPW